MTDEDNVERMLRIHGRDTVRARLEAKTRKTASCWLWTGPLNTRGYGHMVITCTRAMAHRVSYWINRGQIPKGESVLHACDVPACVNPEHLRVGTARDNAADAIARGRTLRGERGTKAKLTEQQALEVIRLWSQGERTQAQIAGLFGVTGSTVANIASGKTWVHLPRPRVPRIGRPKGVGGQPNSTDSEDPSRPRACAPEAE